MNTYDFKGQTAVVTGGAQGIGYAVVQRLLAGGAKVALWDQSAEALQSAKESLSGQGEVATFQVDITDLKQVEAAADATGHALGPISVLVNSAGIAGANAPVASYAPDEWNKVISVNLTGTFNVNHAPSVDGRTARRPQRGCRACAGRVPRTAAAVHWGTVTPLADPSTGGPSTGSVPAQGERGKGRCTHLKFNRIL